LKNLTALIYLGNNYKIEKLHPIKIPLLKGGGSFTAKLDGYGIYVNNLGMNV
jgi:hypothetical protein